MNRPNGGKTKFYVVERETASVHRSMRRSKGVPILLTFLIFFMIAITMTLLGLGLLFSFVVPAFGSFFVYLLLAHGIQPDTAVQKMFNPDSKWTWGNRR